ncbi:putative microtubule-binding protein TANGLED [Cinnamomum micranthum f. kanehirae]|uniref:Putative microtubule-binding protein TANGLED n=1 Tax=Cinnamomum micranthum f. kanehirae TaxID=337451 RepID=A0A3S3R380_9MAGN|nr:putative microtubule-binding protein TANGLED [Cinnamomum micranthum f. kanehirae]
MVARTPTKEKKMAPVLNPNLLIETVKKVDRCMARLQELQYTVSGGTKVISGVSLSPRSTRGYIKTSLRCKQESLRIRNSAARKSPKGKMPEITAGEWRRMSLPAMLVGETVHEILQASRFAKEVVTAVHNANKTASDGPRTPETDQKKNQPHSISTHMKARRKMEKQGALQLIRSEPDPLSLQRVRSRRINFKPSPPKKQALGKENLLTANRVSPKNRPWAKKTVLFPNPLFSSSPSSQQHKFCKTRSPIIAKSQQTPHKFIIKSPPASAKFQVKIKNPTVTLSPPRPLVPRKKSPLAMTTSKLRQSFSPSRLANRLVSPLKNRISVQKSGGLINGLKQRPPSTPLRVSSRKI